jgi:hypothetical protein
MHVFMSNVRPILYNPKHQTDHDVIRKKEVEGINKQM